MAHISIVIPVYKVPESYFHACMESVLNQTLSDIEVVLVDDGSPDACGAICDAYAKKDGRVRVLHQENQGVSAARNKGMDAATGKWLMFVDADDWIELNTCEKAVEAAERLDVQVLRFGLFLEWEQHREEVRALLPSETVLVRENKKQIIKAMLNSQIPSPLLGPYCAVFRLKELKDSGVCFPVGIPWGEDQIFQLHLAVTMERIAYFDACMYHYRQRNTSVTSKYRDDFVIFQERYMELVEEVIYGHATMDDTLQQMFYIWRIGSMQRILYQHYFHPDAPLPYSRRIQACNVLMGKPANREAIEKIDTKELSLKYKVYVYCLRRRMYVPLVLLKRIWNLAMRRKAYA